MRANIIHVCLYITLSTELRRLKIAYTILYLCPYQVFYACLCDKESTVTMIIIERYRLFSDDEYPLYYFIYMAVIRHVCILYMFSSYLWSLGEICRLYLMFRERHEVSFMIAEHDQQIWRCLRNSSLFISLPLFIAGISNFMHGFMFSLLLSNLVSEHLTTVK